MTFPEWVAVTVYRLVGGRRCAFTEEVYWQEAYSTSGGKYSQLPTAMWIKRPKGQLGKCGKAASLRAAFPEECGYAAEEMDGKSLDDMHDGTVLNGTARRVDDGELPKMVDLSMISPHIQKAVTELVRRTTLAGAWNAAYDYANSKFSGLDLIYAIAELNKAEQASKVMTKSFDAEDQLSEDTSMPPVSKPASEALSKARETLGSLR